MTKQTWMAGLLLGLMATAQTAGRPPQFGVVSIRRQASNYRLIRNPEGPVHPGGKYIDHQATLWSLIAFAHPQFVYPNKTVVGLPNWAFGLDVLMDVEAEPEPGTTADLSQMQKMMDALLADRFGLRYHTEQRTMAVYFLRVALGGPHHIHSSAPAEQSLQLRVVGGAVYGRGASMDELAGKIGAYYEDRPVLNRTGLEGFFDIDAPAPLGIAMEREHGEAMMLRELKILGMKLVAGKADVPVMVVDRVTLPIPNP